MKRRFSDQELFEVRNHIPVDMLIRDRLQMMVKLSNGMFRFRCPICHEFETSTNSTTNLARCFKCNKNFNTIDMVMIVKGTVFVESVRYLKEILRDISSYEDKRGELKEMLQRIGN